MMPQLLVLSQLSPQLSPQDCEHVWTLWQSEVQPFPHTVPQ
jgi:hypothetical protein